MPSTVSGVSLSLPSAAERTIKAAALFDHGFNASTFTARVVASTQPEQVPVLSRYLPSGVLYVTPRGMVYDERVTDWRNGLERLRAGKPGRDLVWRHLQSGPAPRFAESQDRLVASVRAAAAEISGLLGYPGSSLARAEP